MKATTSIQPPANGSLKLSAAGLANLIAREGIIRHFYNDSAHNCTYGVGTLAHLGPCTPEELSSRVSHSQIQASLQRGIDIASNAVRRAVVHHALTQDQFDALVSFAYNVGAGGAGQVLRLIDQGQFVSAANLMTRYTHATVRTANGLPERDAHGNIVTRTLPGLVTRRFQESGPFRRAAAAKLGP